MRAILLILLGLGGAAAQDSVSPELANSLFNEWQTHQQAMKTSFSGKDACATEKLVIAARSGAAQYYDASGSYYHQLLEKYKSESRSIQQLTADIEHNASLSRPLGDAPAADIAFAVQARRDIAALGDGDLNLALANIERAASESLANLQKTADRTKQALLDTATRAQELDAFSKQTADYLAKASSQRQLWELFYRAWTDQYHWRCVAQQRGNR